MGAGERTVSVEENAMDVNTRRRVLRKLATDWDEWYGWLTCGDAYLSGDEAVAALYGWARAFVDPGVTDGELALLMGDLRDAATQVANGENGADVREPWEDERMSPQSQRQAFTYWNDQMLILLGRLIADERRLSAVK
jgi:hypothetical protein